MAITFGCLRSSRISVSAGGQLEQPCDVNSSTTTGCVANRIARSTFMAGQYHLNSAPVAKRSRKRMEDRRPRLSGEPTDGQAGRLSSIAVIIAILIAVVIAYA